MKIKNFLNAQPKFCSCKITNVSCLLKKEIFLDESRCQLRLTRFFYGFLPSHLYYVNESSKCTSKSLPWEATRDSVRTLSPLPIQPIRIREDLRFQKINFKFKHCLSLFKVKLIFYQAYIFFFIQRYFPTKIRAIQ